MEFTLTLELGNDGMLTGRDIAATLRTVALVIGAEHEDEITRPVHTHNVRDINGNTVGHWRIAEPIDTRYNGYTNYETWAVALWIDNESNACIEDARDHAATSTLALREWFTDYFLTNHETDEPHVSGFLADLVNASMGNVDWPSLARHYREVE